MRIRIVGALVALVAAVAGCSSAPPQFDATPPAVQTPLDRVDTARDVVADLNQRQMVLEGELRDPFSRP